MKNILFCGAVMLLILLLSGCAYPATRRRAQRVLGSVLLVDFDYIKTETANSDTHLQTRHYFLTECGVEFRFSSRVQRRLIDGSSGIPSIRSQNNGTK